MRTPSIVKRSFKLSKLSKLSNNMRGQGIISSIIHPDSSFPPIIPVKVQSSSKQGFMYDSNDYDGNNVGNCNPKINPNSGQFDYKTIQMDTKLFIHKVKSQQPNQGDRHYWTAPLTSPQMLSFMREECRGWRNIWTGGEREKEGSMEGSMEERHQHRLEVRELCCCCVSSYQAIS